MHIIGDSQLVLWQLIGEYKCNNLLLAPYYTASTQLLDSFHSVDFEYMPRKSNSDVDELRTSSLRCEDERRIYS